MESVRTMTISQFIWRVHQATGNKFVFVLALSILASMTEGISLILLIPIIGILGAPADEAGNNFDNGAVGRILSEMQGMSLEGLLLLFVLVIFARAVFVRWKDIQVNALIHDYVSGLQTSLFASVAGARWSYLARLRGADVNHALLSEIERVHRALAQLLFLSQTVIVLAIYTLVALLLSPVMAILGALLGVTILAAMMPVRKAARAHGIFLTERRREQFRIISEFISGMKTAKAVNSEKLYYDLVRRTLRQIRESTLKFIKIHTLNGLIFQTCSALGLALFAYLATTKISLSHTYTITLILIFIRGAPQVTAVQGSWQELVGTLPAVAAMYQLRQDANAHRDTGPRLAGPSPVLSQHIRFENVAFSYPESELTTLRRINFMIPAKRVTAIIGPSGSGKSTIADLLMGLLEPTEGRILIDQTELGGANRRSWRDSIAYVAQESFLLHDTLAANLAFGWQGINNADMWQALATAGARQFVEALPLGLDTIVGDRGLRLSGGERQRISLARALLRRPQLLILDEATSALDWESQSLIAKAIGSLKGEITVVTIAHRPSLISFADWVVSIRDGAVIETGHYSAVAEAADSYLSKVIRSEG